ncbi:hypothetical protein [Scrofimicrobium canadense]|nr:hypothetical protein [Scrofimicrobium canadense]
MRVRLSLELRINRDHQPEPEPRETDTYSRDEKADPPPIGFQIDMPNHD